MMRRLLFLVLVAWSVCPSQAAAAGRVFAWHAQVVRVDGPVATLRVPVSAAAMAGLRGREAGAALSLVWSAAGDEVVYAPPATDLTAVTYGFVTNAELVSVDGADALVSVRVPFPAERLAAVTGQAGRWVRVQSPVLRGAGVTAVADVTAAERPVKARPAAAQSATPGIVGLWTVSATRKSGVSVGADCTFKEAAGALSGVCVNRREGPIEISGQLSGTKVTFRYLTLVQGDVYQWSGELDAAGTAMKGTVRVADEVIEFTAAK